MQDNGALHKKLGTQEFSMGRTLSNFEYVSALNETGGINGLHLAKIYEISPNHFRLDFGKNSLIIMLGSYFYLTASPPSAPGEPSAFTMYMRKMIGGRVLSSFAQYKSDRIFILSFSDGLQVVLEMFSNGNLFLLDRENTILRPYHFKQSEKKNYKAGGKYVFPDSKPSKIPPGEAEWKALLQDAPLSASAVKWPIGKIYVLEALARCKISPDRKPSDLSDAQADLFLKALSDIAKHPKPCVYALKSGNAVAEVSLTPLSHFPEDAYAKKEFPSWCGALEFFFTSVRSEIESAAAKEEPPELKKLRARLDEQQRVLAKTNEEIEQLQNDAAYLSSNLSLIEGRIAELNDGASCPVLSENEKVDWKKKKYYLKPF